MCRVRVKPGGATLEFVDTMCVQHPDFRPLLAGPNSTKTHPFWRDMPLKMKENYTPFWKITLK